MDPVFLSRLQFALTISFHYIFPPMTIGLGLILVVMEAIYLKTRKKEHEEMTRFWVKVFALIFSIGVASGIVMEFQFGTNWSNYSRMVGDVFGAALAAEGVFAFFLESGFLALLIFGWDKVKPATHFFATCMVSLGSMFSAIWIVVADSWMQTPAGYHIVTNPDTGVQRAELTGFWAAVFNPSAMDRLFHTIMGAWQAAAWLVISVSAYYLIKKRHTEFAKTSIKIAIGFAVAASCLQLYSGHRQAMIVAEHQPAKMAAYEGLWKTEPAGMFIFGYSHQVTENGQSTWQTNGLEMPGMLSWLIHGNAQTPVRGLNEFAPNIPPVGVVFQTYHAMVGIGMTLIALSLLGLLLWWTGKLWTARWYLWLCVFAVLLPQAANQLGWFSAEVGRQPWIVYNLMKTSDAVSPVIHSGQVLGSIVMFGVMYGLLFVLFVYLLDQKIRHGPEEAVHPEPGPGGEPVPLLQGDRANA